MRTRIPKIVADTAINQKAEMKLSVRLMPFRRKLKWINQTFVVMTSTNTLNIPAGAPETSFLNIRMVMYYVSIMYQVPLLIPTTGCEPTSGLLASWKKHNKARVP